MQTNSFRFLSVLTVATVATAGACDKKPTAQNKPQPNTPQAYAPGPSAPPHTSLRAEKLGFGSEQYNLCDQSVSFADFDVWRAGTSSGLENQPVNPWDAASFEEFETIVLHLNLNCQDPAPMAIPQTSGDLFIDFFDADNFIGNFEAGPVVPKLQSLHNPAAALKTAPARAR